MHSAWVWVEKYLMMSFSQHVDVGDKIMVQCGEVCKPNT